jgi:hypothetical protein
MRRRRKFTPTPRPVVPQVRRIVNGAADTSATALVQDELAWVVYACNLHASEYCYWMLVAPSPRFWSAHEQTRQSALLALVSDLTRDFGFIVQVDAFNQPVGYAEPCWIWVLRDPTDRFYLMSPDQELRTVEWSAMPSLDPAIAKGSRDALRWLFPQEAQDGLPELDCLL